MNRQFKEFLTQVSILKQKNAILLLCAVSCSLFVMIPKGNASINKVNYVDANVIQSYNATNTIVSSSSSLSIPKVTIGDGKISPLWNDITGTTILSYGNGIIKSFFDQNNVYFLIVQKPDVNWLAIQWDTLGIGYNNIAPMEKGDDMWIFGNTPHGEYGDAFAVGQGILPKMDALNNATNNLEFERVLINDSNGNILNIDWEISRKLITNDIAGHDIQFNNTKANYTLLFASSNYHQDLSKTTRSSFEFSNLTLGQTVVTSSTATNNNVVLIDRYFYTQFELGLIIGIIMIVITLYLPMFLKIYRRK